VATANSQKKEFFVGKERRQYLIAPRRGIRALAQGVQPMSATSMEAVIKTLQRYDCEIVREIKPRRQLTTLSSVGEATSVYVARMDPGTAQLFSQSAPPGLIIEEDAYLTYGMLTQSAQLMRAGLPGTLSPTANVQSQPIKFKLVGVSSEPVANAKVMLQGEGFSQEGVTDQNGEVTLKLFSMQSGRARALFVDPTKDYWTQYLLSPVLSTNQTNVIRLRSLRETVQGFPQDYKFGWGQISMGLNELPDEFRGQGIKIAVIDSGADNTHPSLTHIQQGVDMTDAANPQGWVKDVVGHGTHCAGVIGANGTSQVAFRGFAPDAEIHILKVFPGGQFSLLLDALDYCISAGVDVVNMSLGAPEKSEALEQKIEEVVQNGIACVVAAGNSGGPVMFPGTSSNVLTVSAVGHVNTYPADTWDAQTVSEPTAQDGTFSAAFTCFGPEVNVCGPGVAIISTVPDNGFDPQAGTSMAAPHVTGLAALLCAHHPSFKQGGRFSVRNKQRVAELFKLIASSTIKYDFGPGRTGFGLPTLHSHIAAMQQAAPRKFVSAMSFSPMGALNGQANGGRSVSDEEERALMEQLGRAVAHAITWEFQKRQVTGTPETAGDVG
jgi:subtilisin